MLTKRAFTLAEVLVTLCIIGVIAAMTIPGLKKDAEMREYVAGCKKAYSVASQVMSRAEMDNGPFKRWMFKDADRNSIQRVYDYISPYFNITKTCAIDTDGCWSQTKVLGTKSFSWASKTYCPGADTIAFKTVDGMNWCIDGASGNDGNRGVNYGSSLTFYVDVNGDKKPNQFGSDVFVFFVDPNRGVVPAGIDNKSVNCSSSGNGVDCAAKVLREGKMDY